MTFKSREITTKNHQSYQESFKHENISIDYKTRYVWCAEIIYRAYDPLVCKISRFKCFPTISLALELESQGQILFLLIDNVGELMQVYS